MKFKPYPRYKDSGIEWLREVPEHWEIKRAKYLFNLAKRPALESDGVVTAFRDGQVTLRSNRRETGFTNAIKEIGYQGVKKGDLVIHAMDAFAGAIGISDSDGKCSPVYSCCLPRKGINNLFFARMLRILALNGYIESLAKGIRERSTDFRWSDFYEQFLPVPETAEQVQIADFLNKETRRINTLIEEKNRFVELLKEKRQALISHAVTKGLDPTVKMKDSRVKWLGEVPEHWTVKPLRYLADVLRGKFSHRPRNDPALYDGDFPFIQTGDITGTPRYITEFKQTLNDRGILVSKKFPKGTLVMAIAANIGDVAILDFPAYFPDSIVGLIPKQEIKLIYLFYLMQAMKQPMIMTATINTQMNLNVDRIISLVAPCPPQQEQLLIVEYLDKQLNKIDALIQETQTSIELLKEHRSALISAAVTGKIDVREAA
jgi:type I restriction enzyme S subunit